eukprot:397347-Rhodomonas_salina.1
MLPAPACTCPHANTRHSNSSSSSSSSSSSNNNNSTHALRAEHSTTHSSPSCAEAERKLPRHTLSSNRQSSTAARFSRTLSLANADVDADADADADGEETHSARRCEAALRASGARAPPLTLYPPSSTLTSLPPHHFSAIARSLSVTCARARQTR